MAPLPAWASSWTVDGDRGSRLPRGESHLWLRAYAPARIEGNDKVALKESGRWSTNPRPMDCSRSHWRSTIPSIGCDGNGQCYPAGGTLEYAYELSPGPIVTIRGPIYALPGNHDWQPTALAPRPRSNSASAAASAPAGSPRCATCRGGSTSAARVAIPTGPAPATSRSRSRSCPRSPTGRS